MLPLEITITQNLAGLRATPQALAKGYAQAMQRSVFRVLRRARQNLSGRFLRVRTNRLRGSVTEKVFQAGDELVGIVGTNVFYGKIHEFGGTFTFTRTFQAKFRRTRGGGLAFARRRSRIVAESIPVIRTVTAHFPSRPWLRTALAESKEEIVAEFRKAVERAALAAGG